jgi:hypothetical protein
MLIPLKSNWVAQHAAKRHRCSILSSKNQNNLREPPCPKTVMLGVACAFSYFSLWKHDFPLLQYKSLKCYVLKPRINFIICQKSRTEQPRAADLVAAFESDLRTWLLLLLLMWCVQKWKNLLDGIRNYPGHVQCRVFILLALELAFMLQGISCRRTIQT